MIMTFVYFFRIDFTLTKSKYFDVVVLFFSSFLRTCCWVICEAVVIEKMILKCYLWFILINDWNKILLNIVPHRHTNALSFTRRYTGFRVYALNERDRNKYTKQSTPSFVRLFVLRWMVIYIHLADNSSCKLFHWLQISTIQHRRKQWRFFCSCSSSSDFYRTDYSNLVIPDWFFSISIVLFLSDRFDDKYKVLDTIISRQTLRIDPTRKNSRREIKQISLKITDQCEFSQWRQINYHIVTW